METVLDNRVELASELGLRPDADLFVGKVRGFPVGLKIIDPQGTALMLFQIRHWLKSSEAEAKTLSFDEAITRLLAERKISLDFDDRIAWLTVNESYRSVESSFVTQLLNSVLQTFQDAGFLGDSELCHYCQKEKVTELSVFDGKVGQICAACLGERERKIPTPTGDAVPIFLMTPFGALASALLWTGCWMLYDYILSLLPDGSVPIPRLLIAFVALGIGIVTGSPIGGIIRMNRRRGNASSLTAAVLFAVGALVFGEIIFAAWLIWRWYDVFSVAVAVKVLPQIYMGTGFFYLGLKSVAAVTCVSTAYQMARPVTAKMRL